MSKAKELRDEFEKDLKELQDNCPHTESTWMDSMWAPGHFGPRVRVCKECDKILEQEKWEAVIKDVSENTSCYGYAKKNEEKD
jgi:hypothetical protein